MQVGVGGRDVKKGSSGPSQGCFATADRFSWSASNRVFVLFRLLQTACLPAARRTRKALGPWLITTDVAGWQQGRQVARYLCWQGQISVPFLVRDAGFEGYVSAVRSRGPYCTISVSVRGIVANDGHHRIVKGPGLASWLVISLLRRMCFRRRD